MKIHINDLAILINGPPEVILLTIDFDEDLIDVEGIDEASTPKALALLAGQALLSFQAADVNGTELDAPQADRFAADGDT